MDESELLLLVRSLPGTHFREDNHNWITIREDVLMQVIEEIIKGEKVSFI
jgi:frataxin-like iron-binding protein CyaY